MKEYSCYIKRGLTDRISRELIINGDYITFKDKTLAKDTFTTFFKSEITDCRFGIHWLRLRLVFGTQYRIIIRNNENKILKITFKSYFRYRLNELHQQYCDILEALWVLHFRDITMSYIKKYENNEEFSICDVHFKNDGITLKTDVFLKEQATFIPWEKIRTKSYYSNFSIYSEEDPANINRGYNYMEDWNVNVLFSALRGILSAKNIETYD